MKIIREHINEKFTEDSDPIHDIGIGMDVLIKQFIEKETKYPYVKKDLLWICAKHGKIEFVKYLLNKGYDVHAENDDALRWASVRGHTEIVKVLLNAGADVHAYDDQALRLGIINVHTEVVKVLKDWIAKEKKKKVNEKFSEDSDPIHDMGIGMDELIKRFIENETDYSYSKEDLLWICAENGKTEFVKYLIEKGYDVHVDDDYALRWASANGHNEIVKVLLNAGADVHARNDWALQAASFYGYNEVVKVLKDWIAKEKKGIVKESLNEKFTEDSDPIHDMGIGMNVLIKQWIEKETSYSYSKEDLLWICARYGKTEFVKYLIDKGYDVHANDDRALHWASYYGHTEIVKVLLNAGANVHAGNDAALRHASEKGHVEVVKLLLDAGANVHADNDQSLRFAGNRGHTEVVKVLRDWIAKEKKNIVKESLNEKFIEDSDPIHDMGIGMDVLIKRWIENETGYQYVKKDLLWICAKHGKTEFVKYLIGKGYDVHADYDVALRWASENRHTETVKVLLDAGADVHADDNYALRYASLHGYTEVVKVLLDYRADIHAKNDDALKLACTHGKVTTARLLLSQGAKITPYLRRKYVEWERKGKRMRIRNVLRKYL